MNRTFYKGKESLTIDDMLEMGISPFPDHYDFYDESHRKEFEQKFIDYYGNLDIAYATIGMFKRRFRANINLIMPKYKNKFLLMVNENDLYNIDVLTTGESNTDSLGKNTNKSTSNSQSDSKGDSKQRALDTPSERISDLNDERYISFAENNSTNTNSKGTAQNDSTSNQETKSVGKNKRHEKGYRGNETMADMKIKLQGLYTDLDAQIIGDLDKLFYGLL